MVSLCIVPDDEDEDRLVEWLLDRATMTDAVARKVDRSRAAKLALARAVPEIIGRLVVWRVSREAGMLDPADAELLALFEAGRVITLRSPHVTLPFARSLLPDAVIVVLDLVLHERGEMRWR